MCRAVLSLARPSGTLKAKQSKQKIADGGQIYAVWLPTAEPEFVPAQRSADNAETEETLFRGRGPGARSQHLSNCIAKRRRKRERRDVGAAAEGGGGAGEK
jgi:hypothetical protein